MAASPIATRDLELECKTRLHAILQAMQCFARHLPVCVLLGVLGCAQAPESAPKPPPVESAEATACIERARSSVRQDDFGSALRILNEAIQRHPSETILWKKRAQVFLLLDAFEPAMCDMDHYAAGGDVDGELLHMRAHALRNLFRPVAALKAYEESKRLGYESRDCDEQIVALQKKVDAKKASLKSMLLVAHAERGSEYWWPRVTLELELGLVKEAHEDLAEWEKCVPREPGVTYATAYVLMEMEDWLGARNALATLGVKWSGEAGIRVGDVRERMLAELCARTGDWTEVLKHTEAVLGRKDAPMDPRLLRIRAMALLAVGRFDEYRACVSLAFEAQQRK
jgi:tetratricopeptide (TPR) repeat protein